VWNVTVRLTTVNGRGCVAETMQSQIGVATAYSLSITDKGEVTLASASGDYACTFTPVADNGGFTTYGVHGYFDCKDLFRPFRCDDGTEHSLFSWGQNISGHVSGTQISGAWDADWEDMASGSGAAVKAQFTGTR
jgi:hypothetical protein